MTWFQQDHSDGTLMQLHLQHVEKEITNNTTEVGIHIAQKKENRMQCIF